MHRYPLPLLSVLAGLALAYSPAQAASPAEESAEFFKSGKVLELALELGPKELDAMRREPRKYTKATLKETGQPDREVAIHLKGAAGSYRGIDDKPNLTVNMDKFKPGQRFHGMDKFHLNNSLQDPSYLSELICGELFRAAGVPASRCGHALLTINGRKRGLYYIKEGYDGYFRKQNFGTKDGNFYDGGFLRDINQPLQRLSGPADRNDQAELKALLAATREKDLKKRFATLEKLLDMDKFISFMVMEVITWDWDGYPMKFNNYRIHYDPKTEKIIFLPSGMDQMFGDPRGPIQPHFEGLVARAVMETPEGRARYYARMEAVMKDVYKKDALIKRLDELEAVVQPALAKVDAGAGRDYKNHVNRLRDAIKVREQSVLDQLKKVKK